jgi:hypothetical protein
MTSSLLFFPWQRKRFDERLEKMRKRMGEPVITRAEVAMHSTPSNMYVIVEGSV